MRKQRLKVTLIILLLLAILLNSSLPVLAALDENMSAETVEAFKASDEDENRDLDDKEEELNKLDQVDQSSLKEDETDEKLGEELDKDQLEEDSLEDVKLENQDLEDEEVEDEEVDENKSDKDSLNEDSSDKKEISLDYKEVLDSSLIKLEKKYLKNPSLGSVGGEWSVLGLARYNRGNRKLKLSYVRELDKILDDKGLDSIGSSKYSDYSRITLALSSLGVDASKYKTSKETYNIVGKLLDKDKVKRQGINGYIFALLAIDSKPYYEGEKSIREEYVEELLSRQNTDGGWSLTGGKSDPDITAMTLQALSKYKKEKKVKDAVKEALDYLKSVQDQKLAGFHSWNSYTSESIAQVIVALTELGIDPEDWTVKSGRNLVDALLDFYDEKEARFKHKLDGSLDQMATEQSIYSLVALDRYKSSKKPLYNMKDAPFDEDEIEINKNDLLELLNLVEDIISKESEYEKDSFKGFKTAYNKAKEILEKNDISQKDIDDAYNNLKDKKDSLKKKEDSSSENNPVKPSDDYASIIVKNPHAKKGETKVYYDKKEFKLRKGETAYSLLERTGLRIKTSKHPVHSGIYIESIEGLAEFDYGPLSGWMYSVNGDFPDYSSSLYKLKDGDKVEWLYTLRLGEDIGGNSSSKSQLSSDLDEEDAVYEIELDGGKSKEEVLIKYKDIKDAITSSKIHKLDLEIRLKSKIALNNLKLEFTEEALDEIRRNIHGDLIISSQKLKLVLNEEALRSLLVKSKADRLSFNFKSLNDNELSKLKHDKIENKNLEVIEAFSLSIEDEDGLVNVLDENFEIFFKVKNDSRKRDLYRLELQNLDKLEYKEDKDSFIKFKTNKTGIFLLTKDNTSKSEEENEYISFKDVNRENWFYDSVRYVVSKGLFKGVSDDYFKPNKEMTRAMLVTVLYRLDSLELNNLELDNYKNTFKDLENNKWYTDAVLWASSKDLVKGYQDLTFRPDQGLTREQLATILYRYADYKGYKTDERYDLESYDDFNSISPWAKDSLSWARAEGIIEGKKDNMLAAKDLAKRSELASILERFDKKYKK